MSLGDEKYVSVATFRRSGLAVSTPTWVTQLPDGRLGFWTSSASGKAKRLRSSSRMTLQPCNARGKVKAGAEPVEATAQMVTSGVDFDDVRRKIKKKYGAMVAITSLLNKLGHIGKGQVPYGDVVVVVTLATRPG